MDSAAAAALVPGAAATAPGAGVRIRVLRPFFWKGRVLAAGAEAEIADARDARALAAWGKAEMLPPVAPTLHEPPPERARTRFRRKTEEDET